MTRLSEVLQQRIALKADKADLSSGLDGKADENDLLSEIATRALQADRPRDFTPGSIVSDRDGKEVLGIEELDGRARVTSGFLPTAAEVGEDRYVELFEFEEHPEFATYGFLAVNVRTGLMRIGSIDQPSARRIATGMFGALPIGGVRSESAIALIWQGGQSLGLGTNPTASEPVLHTSPYHPRNWMLNTGLRGVQGEIQDIATISGFVPAHDNWLPDGNGRGQVPGSSLMAHVSARDDAEGLIRDVLWRAHNQGGQSIANLRAGSQAFQNGVAELQRTISLAADYGRAVWLPAVTWNHGQNDRLMPVPDYLAQLLSLKDEYNEAYLQHLPAGHQDLVMLMVQPACTYNGATPALPAIAQYQAARDTDGFYISTPTYMVETTDPNHIETRWTALIGEYEAKAWYEICVNGNADFKPTPWPSGISRVGTVITLTIDTPYGHDLVLDTDYRAAATNYGFQYTGANIVSVVITDAANGIVEITLDADAGGTLRYAYDGDAGGYATHPGGWGNIRDDDPTPSITLPGRQLHNWLPTFEEIIP